MVRDLLFLNDGLYLSKRFLKPYATDGAIDKWKDIPSVVRIKIDDQLFYLLDTIPRRTKRKLPSDSELAKLERQQLKSNALQSVCDGMHHAYYYNHAKFVTQYQGGQRISHGKAVYFSRLHSVLQYIIEVKNKDGFRDLKGLYDAFNALFPGKYSSKHALSNAVRKAAADGIMTVALDKRVFGNCNENTSQKISEVSKYWVLGMITNPRKYTNVKVLDLVTKECNDKGIAAPSLSWIKKYRQKILRNPEAYLSRYGAQEQNKKMPYASMRHAQYAMQQVQMDGWTMPFWFKENGKLCRMVLVYLIDSSSKMIIGIAIGKNEDTVLIVEAIRDAIRNTSQMPFEIVTDNHAFHKTNEAKNVKLVFDKKGTRFTVTENPQHKAIIERYNQSLDNLCKEYHGYLGQGIRSKAIDALPSPEMFDYYAKYVLSENEIKGIAVSVVNKYNNAKGKGGLSPLQMFQKLAIPHPLQANEFDRAELLTMQTEKLIRRGQINFTRGMEKYEYQLPADLYLKYNDKTVVVRYEDLNEGIYLFDADTSDAITYLQPKEKISGALVNQTDHDRDLLYKNKGRITGIRTQARKQIEAVRDKALQADPDAYLVLNRMTTPKDVLQEMEQDASLRRMAEDRGIDIKTLSIPPRPHITGTKALQPVPKDRNPFKVKGSNTIERVSILDQMRLNDDENNGETA